MGTIQVLDIVPGTSVDGVGLRTSIYLAGCKHCCKGCHNPQSWDFNAGTSMKVEEIIERVVEEDCNVTITGGDPLWQIDKVLPLVKEIKQKGYNIWCYTGFTWEEIRVSSQLSQILEWIDVIVDGRFIEEQRDISLRFRGSSNQRIIDVQKSLKTNLIQTL